jgi:hypothetical protein
MTYMIILISAVMQARTDEHIIIKQVTYVLNHIGSIECFIDSDVFLIVFK